MYYIYADGVCIHNSQSPDPKIKVISPKLSMSDNAAGSLTFSVSPESMGYDLINRLTTEITVKRKISSSDQIELWSGRVINETTDFWNNRNFTCEGELGYLNDTSQPPAEYHDITPADLLRTFIRIHNEKCPNKQFTVGAVTVTDPNDSLYRYTNFESTYEAIKEKLIDRLGGHLRVRKENGVRYLDYLADYPNTNTQTIEFGKNLVDFTKNFDMTTISTVIVPLGCNVTELGQESSIEALEEYLTVQSVNGSIYVGSQEAINEYGWIESVVHWDNVKDPSILLNKARAYLSDVQFEEMVLELTAVDMHYFDINTEAIDILDEIRCISTPHGMDKVFPITKIEIPLDKPDDTTYILGTKIKGGSISASIKDANVEVKRRIDSMVSSSEVLNRAKADADAIINMYTNGYINIVTEEDEYGTHSESLIISNNKDYTVARKFWKWNINGLAHYNLDVSNLPNLAMTMDGTIVADRIKTGKLSDGLNYNYWNLATGEFKIRAVSGSTIADEPIASTTYANSAASSAASSAVTYYDTYTLNQQKVFNKLTNNGAIQGLYMQGNQLYINATYIQTGSLSADLVRSGSLISQNGKTKIDLNNNEIYSEKITIYSEKFAVYNNKLYSWGVDPGSSTDAYGILVDSGEINFNYVNTDEDPDHPYQPIFNTIKLGSIRTYGNSAGTYSMIYFSSEPENSYNKKARIELESGSSMNSSAIRFAIDRGNPLDLYNNLVFINSSVILGGDIYVDYYNTKGVSISFTIDGKSLTFTKGILTAATIHNNIVEEE